MRKQYLGWMILVFGIVGVAYGVSLLIYHFNHGNGLYAPALVLFIFGLVALITLVTLSLINYFQKKKIKEEPVPEEKEDVKEVKSKEEITPTSKPEVKSRPKEKSEYVPKSERKISSSSSTRSYYSVYIKQVGYGPIMRVDGDRILDMRNNTYYRIEGNMVKQEGYGPLFEIRGNQIKNAFGGYLYEISGSNINKVYGGFYASISGHYITLYDLSVKYEMTDSLSKNQLLAVAALLFGKY